MAKTYVYDPDKITVQIAGVYVTGLSDNGVVEIEQNEDDVTPTVGVTGEIHYTLNHDKTAKATIPVMSTSPMIPFLRDLAKDNRDFNVTMVDLNDNGINISCDNCRILKTPDYKRNKEAEETPIEIFIPEIK